MKEDTLANLCIILLALIMIIGVIAVAWLVIDMGTEEQNKCIKICNLKEMEFYNLPPQHDKCECLNKFGDIVWVSR